RAMIKSPDSVDAFLGEVEGPARQDRRLGAFVDRLKAGFTQLEGIESRARRLVEQMALALQGALMVQHAPKEVADAFLRTRLEGDWGHAFGTLPGDVRFREILERHRVHVG